MSAERTIDTLFDELDIIGMDPLVFWNKLGGGWDMLKERTYSPTYRFMNKYPYSHNPWQVEVNVYSGEIKIEGGPKSDLFHTNACNVRLYEGRKIEFYSADGKIALSIEPQGVSSGERHSGPFPIGNPPMGNFSRR